MPLEESFGAEAGGAFQTYFGVGAWVHFFFVEAGIS